MNQVEAYERYIWPMMERVSPNRAHEAAINALSEIGRYNLTLKALEWLFDGDDERALQTKLPGMELSNPLLLAAGFDKDGRAVELVKRLGFAGMEVGSVLSLPQRGIEWPNIFRLGGQNLLNNMGFPSLGMEAAGENLGRVFRDDFAVGINVGVNWFLVDEAAVAYSSVIKYLYDKGDFFVINISSPNTAGLRDLTAEVENLRGIIRSSFEAMREKGGANRCILRFLLRNQERCLRVW